MNDIISIISRAVELHPIGNKFSGLCPLHNDKDSPSLVIYPSTNSWCCFGSGCSKNGKPNGGDAIEWVKQYYHLPYRDAVQWLEKNGNVKVELPQLPKPKPQIVPPKLIVYWHGLLDQCNRRDYYHSRGFKDDMIDREWWGWDGSRYVVPVWENEPVKSNCLGVRLRASELSKGPKYIGMDGHNQPALWGRHYCQNSTSILCFAGELDSARAVQDGLPAISIVNGIMSVLKLEDGWPNKWFPNAKYLMVFFDKKEEVQAARLAQVWNKYKGFMTGRVFHYPPWFDGKDFNDWRDFGYSAQNFMDLVTLQLGV